ncbi:MAG: hypothetical protein ACP5QA_12850, partial [Phycisphaerae bacterium]
GLVDPKVAGSSPVALAWFLARLNKTSFRTPHTSVYSFGNFSDWASKTRFLTSHRANPPSHFASDFQNIHILSGLGSIPMRFLGPKYEGWGSIPIAFTGFLHSRLPFLQHF